MTISISQALADMEGMYRGEFVRMGGESFLKANMPDIRNYFDRLDDAVMSAVKDYEWFGSARVCKELKGIYREVGDYLEEIGRFEWYRDAQVNIDKRISDLSNEIVEAFLPLYKFRTLLPFEKNLKKNIGPSRKFTLVVFMKCL